MTCCALDVRESTRSDPSTCRSEGGIGYLVPSVLGWVQVPFVVNMVERHPLTVQCSIFSYMLLSMTVSVEITFIERCNNMIQDAGVGR